MDTQCWDIQNNNNNNNKSSLIIYYKKKKNFRRITQSLFDNDYTKRF